VDSCASSLIGLKSKRMPIKNNPDPEDWFLSQIENFLRSHPPGERTPQCVDDHFLSAYSAKPSNQSLSDPRVEHVTSCSFCLRRLLEIREGQRDSNIQSRPSWRRGTVLFGGPIAACLIVGFLTVTIWQASQTKSVVQRQVAEEPRTLDLSEYGTYRGEQPKELPPLSLPPALVRVELILPRLSRAGNYWVGVATDKTGKHIIADAKAVAVGTDPHTTLSILLDLRSAKPGMYALSTERESDGGPYYYPLKVE
jgi:hypothetical protein